MNNKPFGIIPALSTLTNDSGDFDEESERSLVRKSIEWGSSGLAVSIIAGEFYKFTDSERKKSFEVVVDETNDKIPVWAGISHLGTASSIELGRHAKNAGVDGIIAQPALAGKEAPLALYEHFSKIFSSIDLPVMIQDAEDFNGIKIEPGLYAKLANEFSHFVCVKIEGGKTLDKMRETKITIGDRLTILGGMGGRLLLEELPLGAVGSIPNPCMTDIIVEAYRLFRAGQIEDARTVFSRYRPWLEFQLQHSQSASEIVKETLRLRGIVKSSFTRSPHVPMDAKSKSELRLLVEEMGLFRAAS
jgi:dihydrodipicolinate synthase/N-acetylneuraminate lyase